ncbi:MAG: CoA transferase [Gammaproteobacteria bacterium]|nr:CoA transferase [Gammaproteobacteria bacterium]MCP5198801.1 CoA transferase [Gammaproteobacteria bacterium]
MSALDTNGVLEGIVVLDLTQMLAGPYCTMILADHGADVIKIEPPGGDMSRAMGPYLAEDGARTQGGYFHSINRNKRSMVLDLKNADDRDAFLSLVEQADVVVENYRAGVMERLGLGYEALHARNPRLVYACIRGFGDARSGVSPYGDWPAFDIVAQAMSGFMAMTGPPGTPMKAGPGVGDIIPGVMAAFGVVAAVRHAEQTGHGQFVDVGMVDAMIAVCERNVYRYSFGGAVSKPEGNDHPLVSPFSVYRAADGWMALGCPTDSQWHALLEVMQQPALAADPRFVTNEDRARNQVELRAIIEDWTSTMTKHELSERLGGRVPCGPVNDITDIVADPHATARDMLPTIDLPGLDRRAAVAGVPVKFSAAPGRVRHAGPALGEHTQEVLDQFRVTRVRGLGEDAS